MQLPVSAALSPLNKMAKSVLSLKFSPSHLPKLLFDDGEAEEAEPPVVTMFACTRLSVVIGGGAGPDLTRQPGDIEDKITVRMIHLPIFVISLFCI
jgi:hypothetical protein